MRKENSLDKVFTEDSVKAIDFAVVEMRKAGRNDLTEIDVVFGFSETGSDRFDNMLDFIFANPGGKTHIRETIKLSHAKQSQDAQTKTEYKNGAFALSRASRPYYETAHKFSLWIDNEYRLTPAGLLAASFTENGFLTQVANNLESPLKLTEFDSVFVSNKIVERDKLKPMLAYFAEYGWNFLRHGKDYANRKWRGLDFLVADSLTEREANLCNFGRAAIQ